MYEQASVGLQRALVSQSVHARCCKPVLAGTYDAPNIIPLFSTEHQRQLWKNLRLEGGIRHCDSCGEESLRSKKKLWPQRLSVERERDSSQSDYRRFGGGGGGFGVPVVS